MGSPIISGGYAASYFVDALNGSTSNNCISPNTACKNLNDAGMPALASTNNSYLAIYLARGTCEDWRQEFNITSTFFSHSLIGTYGAGSNPLLEASNVITGTDACGTAGTGTWTLVSGQTTCWQSTGLFSDAASGFITFYANGTVNKLLAASQAAACSGSVGSYAVSSVSTNPFTLTFNSGSATNPGSDGNLYEYSARSVGFGCSSTCDYLVLEGISARRQQTNNGSLTCNENCTMINVTANDGTKHNVLCEDGCHVNGLIMSGAWFNSVGSAMIVNFEPVPRFLGNSFVAVITLMPSFDGSVNVFDQHTAVPNPGTVTTSSASPNVTGSGTAFTGAEVGGTLTVGANSCTIASVSSSTALACMGNFPANNTAQAYSILTGFGTVSINEFTATNVSMGGLASQTVNNVNVSGASAAGTTTNVSTTATNYVISGGSCLSVPFNSGVLINSTCNGSAANGLVVITGNGSSFSATGSTFVNNSASQFAVYIQDSITVPSLIITGDTLLSNGGSTNILRWPADSTVTSATINGNTYNCGGQNLFQQHSGTAYNMNTLTGRTAWQGLGFDVSGSTWTNCGN